METQICVKKLTIYFLKKIKSAINLKLTSFCNLENKIAIKMEMLWKTHYWAFHCSSFKHVEVRREKILEPYIGNQTRPFCFFIFFYFYFFYFNKQQIKYKLKVTKERKTTKQKQQQQQQQQKKHQLRGEQQAKSK